ncbi:MAG: ABC transporter ATP-binding protein [Eubacteriales bacterium]|nr:ABC transporter ATP-binding protein [Eubacteriales bacterium]
MAKLKSDSELSKDKRKQTLKRIFAYIRPYRGYVILSLLLAAVTVVLTLLVPILIGNGVDQILGKGQVDFSGLRRTILLIAAAVLITALSHWLMNVLNNKLTYLIVRDLREQAFRHIHVLPLSYLDSHPSGDLISRVVTDAEQFSDGLLLGFTQLFTGVLTLLGTIGFMLSLQPLMALIVILFTPLSFLVARFISDHSFIYFKKQSGSRGSLTNLTNEMLGNLKVVQLFGYEDASTEDFDARNQELAENSLRATFYSSLTNPSTRFLNTLIYNGVVIAGCLLCFLFPWKGVYLSIGRLTSLLTYVKKYSQPFNEIADVLTEFQNALASAGRVFEMIESDSEPVDAEDAVSISHAEGRITIDHVDFSYVPEKPLIEDLSIDAAPGKRIAIVGPTGCGKTTLINLLMRFYDVNSGYIAMDGEDIRHIRRSSLRENYGMVLQDTWLKSGTIRENICYGKPDATEEEMITAAKKAHAHSFIMRMPEGYDTIIEENAGNLSAGQKQLICIARVMLDLPPVLILDEATSSIDTRTEIRIQKAFDEMMKGRTSFIVAHRLSTIRNADTILVMKDGNIIEQGSHETLLAKGGFYSHLYQSQFEKS